MEVKLSVEGEEEEEMDGTELGHVQRDTYMRSSRSRPLNKWRTLICVGVVLAVFCFGECFCISKCFYYHSVTIK